MRANRKATAAKGSARRTDGRHAARDEVVERPAHRGGREGGAPRVRVRMYRPGLGDCFLLTFQPDTADEAHVLVDIGTVGRGAGVPMEEIARDVAAVTGGRLAAVVATHEHADHLSGFPLLADAGVTAGEAWVAWTEDPADPLARQLQKYRGDLFAAAAQAAAALDAAPREGLLGVLRAGVRDLMAFNGFLPGAAGASLGAAAKGGGLKKTIDAMMRSALGLARRGPRYLSPGDVLEPAWAPGVRVYVLGPPRDEAAIRQLGGHGSPDLYELAAVLGVELPGTPGGPAAGGPVQPFDAALGVPLDRAGALGGVAAAYEAEPWRRIDEATLGAAAELALQLDNATNNTSLVLAIEAGGEVLLFPGDAQLGSWLSWPDVTFAVDEGGRRRTVTGEDLLRRVTFYKVGHHASHNATSRPGLELMSGRNLTAFIPLDEGVARRREWPMPARTLFAALTEKTRGRVLKSDGDAEQAALALAGVSVERLHVETTLPLEAPAGARERAAPRARAHA
ncbi:MBL fold metallo-hydrolase [Anaeromyxobacter dehalogenans]|uniref:Metallo-beta-lactamase domain-containing protein n=1 Tax=Anaeromyxobacter dehalogenans (strain 2CP-C) TaxID=290397 RepID=Q2IGE7_ANADE|nr:MBL fold metallo-hydrolase [Anaeromyxobacter dehalogenans]ABC83659.1 hypothetical protein Adeh_3895 [Anaeromyxobacter dehalogenans 2CP-C]